MDVLRSRGLLQDVTSEELRGVAEAEALTVYVGFDPTADAIHLGNLIAVIVLSWFQRCGHTPIALLGGATGRVGDPSGKSAERPVLSDEVIERNVADIGRILREILARNVAGQQVMVGRGQGSSVEGWVWRGWWFGWGCSQPTFRFAPARF